MGARDLVALPRRGLAHLHWRVRGTGALLRVPLLGDAASLERQAETFRRMAPSGHAPRLLAMLAPAASLPGGALLVEEVRGRMPAVPRDFPAIAAALAAIHALPVPPPEARAPLASPAEPFAATVATIERHLAAEAAALPPETREALRAELAWARGFAAAHEAELRAAPRALVVTDAHPRNFVVRSDGRAVCVDLEKACYGAPAIDLAHAALPAAIAWGRRGERVGEGDRERFFGAYFRRRGPEAEAALRPLLPAFRRLVWLRTNAAFVAFRAARADRALGPAARALAHRAMAEALDPRTIAAARRRWEAVADNCKPFATALQ